MVETDAHFIRLLLLIIGNTSVPNEINLFLLEIKANFYQVHFSLLALFARVFLLLLFFLTSSFSCGN